MTPHTPPTTSPPPTLPGVILPNEDGTEVLYFCQVCDGWENLGPSPTILHVLQAVFVDHDCTLPDEAIRPPLRVVPTEVKELTAQDSAARQTISDLSELNGDDHG